MVCRCLGRSRSRRSRRSPPNMTKPRAWRGFTSARPLLGTLQNLQCHAVLRLSVVSACLVEFDHVPNRRASFTVDDHVPEASGCRPPVQGSAWDARGGCSDFQRDERVRWDRGVHWKSSSRTSISAPQCSQCFSPSIGISKKLRIPHTWHRLRRNWMFGPPMIAMFLFCLFRFPCLSNSCRHVCAC